MTVAAAHSLSARKPSRTAGWVLAGTQVGFAAWFAICFLLALARAREFSGFWYIPAIDDRYTATADITGGWGWAFVVTTTMGVAPMVLGIGLVASTLTLLVGYAAGNRRLRAALVTGLVVTLLTLAFAITPMALSVSGWLSD
jgi:hypothetical protein